MSLQPLHNSGDGVRGVGGGFRGENIGARAEVSVGVYHEDSGHSTQMQKHRNMN